MSTITKKELVLMTPGICTRCGEYSDDDRNSVGCCWKCHNLLRQHYIIVRKLQIEENRRNGIKFWESQGIKIGDKVYKYAISMLPILPSEKVIGIAKSGSCGAYVISNFQGGKLSPYGWKIA